MARTRAFSKDAVLDKAMALFWQRGFADTSIADLVTATGINRASLYAAFGSKEALFTAIIDRYLETAAAAWLSELSAEAPADKVLRAFLLGLAGNAETDPARRGCLITNTAVEQPDDGGGAARRIEIMFSNIEAALIRLIRRGQSEGSLARKVSAEQAARHILVFMQGIKVMARLPDARSRIDDAVQSLLSLLQTRPSLTPAPANLA